MFLSLILVLRDERRPSTLRCGQYSFTFVSFSTTSFYSFELSIFLHLLDDQSVTLERESSALELHGREFDWGKFTHDPTLLPLCLDPTEKRSKSSSKETNE